MEHIPAHVLRALWYVDTMSGQGVPISLQALDLFAAQAPPRDAVYGMPLFADLVGLESRLRHPEPVAEYLRKVGWIRQTDGAGVELTVLGRAIRQAGQAQENATSAVEDVVLSPTDPLVYTVLTRRLAAAGAGLLVDPYFKAEQLAWVLECTSIRRILISKKASAKERPMIAVALGTLPRGEDVEVRATAGSDLHDRRIVAEGGGVQLIGSSLNGVGRHQTSVITPEPEIAKAYRESSERLWAGAEKVEPQQISNPVSPPATGQTPAP
ncbi:MULTISPECIES: hypothetical protein [unclassified Streptomyces]|uniref:hypothetical protein n=1 Tax=unclassified Streptomyces TaxID=2593676 RepID=UPI000DC78734|nr:MULTISPECIES: hypothetical protein [unclassified Streptomyces]AWZ07414.1 hypothetical protein DRB89_25595 [Streptomyces sp. ICC4]AWZ12658.1 hypothetical protein DRB96_10355 [Streptomyces sp. ICC1]